MDNEQQALCTEKWTNSVVPEAHMLLQALHRMLMRLNAKD